MLKKLLGVMLVLLAGVSILLADEAKGKVKKVEKNVITVTVDGKDVDYKVGKAAKVYDGDTEVTEKKDRNKLLKKLAEGTPVKVIYTKDGDKITVSEFRVTK